MPEPIDRGMIESSPPIDQQRASGASLLTNHKHARRSLAHALSAPGRRTRRFPVLSSGFRGTLNSHPIPRPNPLRPTQRSIPAPPPPQQALEPKPKRPPLSTCAGAWVDGWMVGQGGGGCFVLVACCGLMVGDRVVVVVVIVCLSHEASLSIQRKAH